MWRCLRDPAFSRFSRTPTCDRRTDTEWQLIPALASVVQVKIVLKTALNHYLEKFALELQYTVSKFKVPEWQLVVWQHAIQTTVTHYASKMWLPQLLHYAFLAVVVTLLVWNNTKIDFVDCRNKKLGKLENEQVVKVIWQQAALPSHMDGSMAFARCRQCATHLTHAFSGPPESKSQTASRSVEPFLHSSPQSVPMLYYGRPFPQNSPFSWGDLDPI